MARKNGRGKNDWDLLYYHLTVLHTERQCMRPLVSHLFHLVYRERLEYHSSWLKNSRKEAISYLLQWQNTFQICMTGYRVWRKAKAKEKYKKLHYRRATSRRLNQVTDDDPYCIPRTEELLDKMRSARYITKLQGFYRVPLHEQDKEKTVFTSPLGKF